MIPVQEIREFQDRNEGTLVTSWLGLLLAEVERVSANVKSANAQAYRNFCDLQEVLAERDVWKADAIRLRTHCRHTHNCAGSNDRSRCDCGAEEAARLHDEAVASRD